MRTDLRDAKISMVRLDQDKFLLSGGDIELSMQQAESGEYWIVKTAKGTETARYNPRFVAEIHWQQ